MALTAKARHNGLLLLLFCTITMRPCHACMLHHQLAQIGAVLHGLLIRNAWQKINHT
jgi:hypothetical protein